MRSTSFIVAMFLSFATKAQDSAFLKPVLNVAGDKITSNLTLNTFFQTKLSSYLSEVSDLSLSKAYAVLDNADGRLFIGGTIGLKRKETRKVRYIVSTGLKANIKNGFASLYGSDGINNDIGISGKFTFFGNGKIKYYKKDELQKEKVRDYRLYLKKRTLRELNSADQAMQKDISEIEPDNRSKWMNDYLTAKKEELKTKFIQDEASFIDTGYHYNTARTWWLSAEVYVPVTQSEYKVSPSLNSPAINNELYKPYEFKLTGNFLFFARKLKDADPFKWLPGTTLFSVSASLIENNVVKNNTLEKYTFNRYLQQASNIDTLFLAQLKTDDVYVGSFSNFRFITPRIGGRIVYMPFSFIGVSAAIEKNFGIYDALNWRLGIPVSLKDKEKKPKINFELIWREINNEHSVGISIGLPIGNTIF